MTNSNKSFRLVDYFILKRIFFTDPKTHFEKSEKIPKKNRIQENRLSKVAKKVRLPTQM